MSISWMFITPSFEKSLIVEQFQGNYLKMYITAMNNHVFIKCIKVKHYTHDLRFFWKKIRKLDNLHLKLFFPLIYTKCKGWTLLTHWLNAFCLPHDNATARYLHFYQQHNNNRIEVNNKRKLPKRWYTSRTPGNNSLRGGRVENYLLCLARHVIERDRAWNWHPDSYRPPFTTSFPGSLILPPRRETWEQGCTIQCAATSFPVSFASSAGRKHISPSIFLSQWQCVRPHVSYQF